MSDVTQILDCVEQGNASATEQLLPLVYGELRRLATARMARERPGQSLDPTELVHEAFLRLVDVEQAQRWNGRGHFFAAAAEAMRRILVESARRREREKHGGRRKRVELSEVRLGVNLPPEALLEIDEMLTQLAASDPQMAELVKLRCFAGLTVEQAADLIGISTRTAYRNWAYARAWVFRKLEQRQSRSAV